VRENGSVNYDEMSRAYDTGRAAHLETTGKIVRLLDVGRNSMILDLGCGTGNYAWAIHRLTKHITGLDLSPGMLAKAHAKYPEMLLLQADVTNLPFESDIFDGAFAIQVFHHVKEKERFLEEAFRTLREEACIALHSCSHQQMQAFWFYHYFPEGLQIDLARMPDSHVIASFLKNAGFTNVGIEICYQDVVVADETPHRYLDKRFRDSISTFAFLSEEDIELGCRRIQLDIATGEVAGIVQRSEREIANCTGGSCIVYGRK
jgi:ubiquinone/menaquinone biosynthesis C-methylase UbiE